MRCIICGATMKDSENKCVKCGSPTAWSSKEPYLFAFSSKDVSMLKKAHQNEIEKQKRAREESKYRDEQKKAAFKAAEEKAAIEKKKVEEEKKQEALRKAEQERIREQNRIAEENRRAELKKADNLKEIQEQIETERKEWKKEHIIFGTVLILVGIIYAAVLLYNTHLKFQAGYELTSNDYWELGIPIIPIISGIIDLYYAKG